MVPLLVALQQCARQLCIPFRRAQQNAIPGGIRVLTLAILSMEAMMLRWALVFFVVALIAAVFGFTGIAVAAAGVAKILFFLFVVLFLITLLGHVARRP